MFGQDFTPFDFEENPLDKSDGSSLMSNSELSQESYESDKVPRNQLIQELLNKTRRCKTAGVYRQDDPEFVDITTDPGFLPMIEVKKSPKKKKKKSKKGSGS